MKKSYIQYWKKRFKEAPITEFCSVININSRPEDIGPKLQYNLLCDGLPEDKQLREQLQMKRLETILQCQQEERTDSHFSRNCLFCNVHFEGNRSVLFQHMVNSHAFNVGLPDNLVYVNEFLDKLEEKIKNLQCLYCEKTFKDKQTLKDHMRKKQHKKINPKNKEFDQYYVINYLELGKKWHDILDEDDTEINQNSRDESWEDWREESTPIHCLFCDVVASATQDLLTHMKESHNFDLLKIKRTLVLGFYEEVKIVNYIRRQVYNFKCIFCKEKLESKTSLLHHLEEMRHFKIPEEKSSWNLPQYFFPTFENDALLCGLPDDDDDDGDDAGDDHGDDAGDDHGDDAGDDHGDDAGDDHGDVEGNENCCSEHHHGVDDPFRDDNCDLNNDIDDHGSDSGSGMCSYHHDHIGHDVHSEPGHDQGAFNGKESKSENKIYSDERQDSNSKSEEKVAMNTVLANPDICRQNYSNSHVDT